MKYKYIVYFNLVGIGGNDIGPASSKMVGPFDTESDVWDAMMKEAETYHAVAEAIEKDSTELIVSKYDQIELFLKNKETELVIPALATWMRVLEGNRA